MIYLFLGLCVLPMLFCFLLSKALYNVGDDFWIVCLGFAFLPIFNVVTFLTFIIFVTKYDEERVEFFRLITSIKLPDFKRLSPEAKSKIKFIKECRDNNIAEMKRLCDAEIKQIESDDAKQELLDKLGLSFQDLETLKALKGKK